MIGAGERALGVAEQFAFEQSLGKGGAVDGDKGPVAAWAEAVNEAGDKLFSRAAFGLDQNIDCSGGGLAGAVEGSLPRGRVPGEAVGSAGIPFEATRMRQHPGCSLFQLFEETGFTQKLAA